MSFELPRPPENLAKLTEDAAKKARAELDAKIVKANNDRVQKNLTMLTQSPQAIRDRSIQMSRTMLESIRTMTTANASLSQLSPILATLPSGDQRSTESRITTIIEALQASPPDLPGPGEQLGQPTGGAQRYLRVWNERSQSEDQRYFTVSLTNTVQSDIEFVTKLLPQANATQRTALETLLQRLRAYATADGGFSDAAHQMQAAENNSVTSQGFAMMGKFIGVLALATYALADGAMAFAHKRMPTGGLVALALSGVIADRGLRRQFLSPSEDITAEEMNTILRDPVFLSLTNAHYAQPQWESTVETLMREAGTVKVRNFVTKLNDGFRPSHNEASQKETRDFLSDLDVARGSDPPAAPTNTIYRSLYALMEQRPVPNRTAFSSLITTLAGKGRATQEAIGNYLRGRRTGVVPPAPAPVV
ncbi:hypothetical protein HZA45_02430 [Candidatus Peregrinibacteria bacterium]|nr:hypothetical protein [Candidatus Peregrinibacteria bacterium]